jgi:hypothetical protein
MEQLQGRHRSGTGAGMSGGHFNYDQNRISQIAVEIENVIYYNDDETPDEYGGTKGHGYSAETITEFKNAIRALETAYVYAQRVDWLLSFDDGEESFHERLASDLKQIAAAQEGK